MARNVPKTSAPHHHHDVIPYIIIGLQFLRDLYRPIPKKRNPVAGRTHFPNFGNFFSFWENKVGWEGASRGLGFDPSALPEIFMVPHREDSRSGKITERHRL
jgi:hypothetical protein